MAYTYDDLASDIGKLTPESDGNPCCSWSQNDRQFVRSGSSGHCPQEGHHQQR